MTTTTAAPGTAPRPRSRRSNRARGGLLAVALAAGWVTVGAPATAQDAPPVQVSVTGTDGSGVQVTDCRGQDASSLERMPSFTVNRTGSTAEDLTVAVSYQGERTAGLPDPVVIPAGSASVTLEAAADPGPPGVLTIAPSGDYSVATPTSAEVTVLLAVADLACNFGHPEAVTQTIPIGSAPEAVDVAGLLGAGATLPVIETEGTLPPGLAFSPEGTWSGKATELGTFAFTTYYCEDESFCGARLAVTVQVVPAGEERPPTPPPARPAQPQRAQATYTG